MNTIKATLIACTSSALVLGICSGALAEGCYIVSGNDRNQVGFSPDDGSPGVFLADGTPVLLTGEVDDTPELGRYFEIQLEDGRKGLVSEEQLSCVIEAMRQAQE